MKKYLFTIAFVLIMNTAVQSQDLPLSFYGGLNISGASSTDFTGFDISDWQNYGLKSQVPNNKEGRVNVDLESMKPSATNIGVMLGASYRLSEKLSALAEIQYTLSGISLTGIYVGLNYDIIKGDKFSLGLTSKVGYNIGSADLGEISLLPGYTPPVILPEGTFKTGDALSMEFSGLALNLGITPSYKVTDKIAVMGFLGFNLGFTSSDGLLSNGVLLPMSAQGVVKSNGLDTQAGIDPTINSTGLSFQIGVMYKL